jgi:Flp pilus assembly protein TadD
LDFELVYADNGTAGFLLAQQEKPDEAIRHWSQAVQLRPDFAQAHHNLGVALARRGNLSEAADHWLAVVRFDPNNAEVHYMLATAMASMGKLDQALEHYTKAVQLKPQIDTSPRLHDLLGMNYATAGRFQEAIVSTQKACDLARAAGDETLLQYIERRLELYRQNKLPEDSPGEKQP